jgi:hypothetical protein
VVFFAIQVEETCDDYRRLAEIENKINKLFKIKFSYFLTSTLSNPQYSRANVKIG